MKRLNRHWLARRVALVASGCAMAVAIAGVPISQANASAKRPHSRLISVSYGISSETLPVEPQYLAQKYGFYKKHGLNVNLVDITAGGSATIASVVSGSTPFAVTSVFQLWNYIEQGAPILAVGQQVQGVYLTLCLQPSVAAARGITAKMATPAMLAALHGLTIGGQSPGSIGNLVLNGLFKKYGISSSTITEVPNQSSADDPLLQAGSIQGYLATSPACQVAEAGGYGKATWQLTSIKQFAISAYGLTFTTPKYAKAHPKIVAALLGALDDTMKWMRTHKKQVQAFATSQFGAPRAQAAEAVADVGFTTTTQIPAISVRNAQALANGFGLTTYPVSNGIEGLLYTNRYYKYR